MPLVERGARPKLSRWSARACETTDVLGRDVSVPRLEAGDSLALLTAGAYGMVMASNYNARPRPPEVLVSADGNAWSVIRRREVVG